MTTIELVQELNKRLQEHVDVNLLGTAELHALVESIEIILLNRMMEQHEYIEDPLATYY